MRVITPQGALTSVEKIVPVDATFADFGDPGVTFVTVPGTREGEAALEVTGPNGTTLVLNDLVGNMPKTSGFGGWFLHLMRFAGDEPRVPVPVKFTMIKDKATLCRAIEAVGRAAVAETGPGFTRQSHRRRSAKRYAQTGGVARVRPSPASVRASRELLVSLRALPDKSVLLNGELVISVDGALSFDALKMRLHRADSRIKPLPLWDGIGVRDRNPYLGSYSASWFAEQRRKMRPGCGWAGTGKCM